jgi:hypothetical protein
MNYLKTTIFTLHCNCSTWMKCVPSCNHYTVCWYAIHHGLMIGTSNTRTSVMSKNVNINLTYRYSKRTAYVYQEIASQNITVNISKTVCTKNLTKNTCHKIVKIALTMFAGTLVTQHTSTSGVTWNCTKTNAASQRYCHINSTGVTASTELKWLMSYWNKAEGGTGKTSTTTTAAPWQCLYVGMKLVTLSGYTAIAPPSSLCAASQRAKQRGKRGWSVHSYEIGLRKHAVTCMICMRFHD